MRSQRLLVTLLSLGAVASYADQVTLKNGDHLTGTVVKSDGKVLTLKTEALGSVDIQMDAIQSFSTDKPVYVQNSIDKKMYTGTVTTQDDTVVVQAQPPVTVAKANIAALRSSDEQAAFEKLQHPGLIQGWSGGANFGFALTAGNSETENLALAVNAARTGLNDKLSIYTNSVYATNNAAGASPSTTANVIQGGVRYDHNLNPHLFGFVGADFMADQLQSLNIRSVFGGGLGYHLIKTANTQLDLLAGANFTHENYDNFVNGIHMGNYSNNFAAGTFGEELTRNLGKSTVVTEKGYIFPDFNDFSQYRATFALGTVTKINKWFGWQNSFGDIYVTNPPTGKKANDILLSTGINISFSH
jgi:putative salt-induced outer membrane protein YdiY